MLGCRESARAPFDHPHVQMDSVIMLLVHRTRFTASSWSPSSESACVRSKGSTSRSDKPNLIYTDIWLERHGDVIVRSVFDYEGRVLVHFAIFEPISFTITFKADHTPF